jgi:hypothetical protein
MPCFEDPRVYAMVLAQVVRSAQAGIASANDGNVAAFVSSQWLSRDARTGHACFPIRALRTVEAVHSIVVQVDASH